MRNTPSQPVTISLPADMLADIDNAAARLDATRSELLRAAVRGYLRNLAAEEALVAGVRSGRQNTPEDVLAAQGLTARRSRRSRIPA